MPNTKRAFLICVAAMSGFALAACDNTPTDPDAAVVRRDANIPPEEDGGPLPDSGPPDGGPRPTPPPFVRLAHFVPGGPAIHVCVGVRGTPAFGLVTRNGMGTPTPIPYRGISSYVMFPSFAATANYTARVYDAADINTMDANPCGTASGDPIITHEVDAGDLLSEQYYTVAALGLPDGADATAPHVLITADDRTAPASGMTRVRLFHAIPNIPVAAVDVCLDPDGPAGPMLPTEIFDNVAFDTASDYIESMPILAGTLSVHAHNDSPIPDCLTMAPPAGTQILGPIPVPFPGIPDPRPAGLERLRDRFAADEIDTAFAVGDARFTVPAADCSSGASACDMLGPGGTASPAGTVCNPATMRCANPLGPTIIPWQDNYVAP